LDDPLAPIAGISLADFAFLCAAMRDSDGDAEACARIAEAHGFTREDWRAAARGWNARIGDPRTAGVVATVYMPLYREALAKDRARRA
jgi:hypothetical protein